MTKNVGGPRQVGDGSADVVMIRLEEDKVLVVADKERAFDVQALIRSLGTVARKLGPLAYVALERAGMNISADAQLFEMSPESFALFSSDEFAKVEVGEYFRAVLRNPKGQAAHQIQLREVSSVMAMNPATLAIAGQMIAMQASLTRIEDSLEALHTKIDSIFDFLKDQQKAKLSSATQIISEVFEKAERYGNIADEDWDRVSQLEQNLESSRIGVRNELLRRLEKNMGGGPKEVNRRIKEMEPQRIVELMSLHGVLTLGLSRWRELYILRKYQMNRLTDHDIESSVQRVDEIESEHRELSAQIETLIETLRNIKRRTLIKTVKQEGLAGVPRDVLRIRQIHGEMSVLEQAPLYQNGELSDSLSRSVEEPRLFSGELDNRKES